MQSSELSPAELGHLRTAVLSLTDACADPAVLRRAAAVLLGFDPGAAVRAVQPAPIARPAPAQPPAPAPVLRAKPAPKRRKPATSRTTADREGPFDPDVLHALYTAIDRAPNKRAVARACGLQDNQLARILQTGRATRLLQSRVEAGLGALGVAVVRPEPLEPQADLEALLAARAGLLGIDPAPQALSLATGLPEADIAAMLDGRADDGPLREWATGSAPFDELTSRMGL